jgi:hypothetical protein
VEALGCRHSFSAALQKLPKAPGDAFGIFLDHFYDCDDGKRKVMLRAILFDVVAESSQAIHHSAESPKARICFADDSIGFII